MAKRKGNFSEEWSVNISEENVPDLVEELIKRTRLSRSQVVTLVLKNAIPEILEDDSKLLELITVKEEEEEEPDDPNYTGD